MLVNDVNRASTSTMGDSIIIQTERTVSFSSRSRDSTLSSRSDQSIRSARAAKVFGDLVTQGENENSLSYSPSPGTKKQGVRSQGLANITNVCRNSPGRILPFGTIQFTTAKKPAPKPGREELLRNVDEGKENEKQIEKETRSSKESVSRNSNDKAKKNREKFKVSKPKTSNDQRKLAIKKKRVLPKIRKRLESNHRYSSTHQVQASKAEDAIKLATESINESLNASRAAKVDHLKRVATEAARLKEEWRADKEDALNFYNEVEKTKREMLDVRSKLSSHYAQNKVDSERSTLQNRLTQLDKEMKFKSNVFVEHKKKLKEKEANRRRLSVAIKAKHRNIRRANSEAMRLESIQEQHEIHELKRGAQKDVEEYKKQCALERRESFAFRNAEARHQRMEESERQAMEKAAESERLELKWQGERDAEEYKKKCAQERRESYAFRNAEGRRQRAEEEIRIEGEKMKESEIHELKRGAQKDVEEYKKQCELERRESFAFRGRECVRRRAVMEEIRTLAKEKEHEYFVLKWAAQDDTKAYLAEVAEERRKSLAFRNKEGRRHRQLMEEWRCEELQKAHEVGELKSACQKDVEEYKKQCAERDRLSLNFRGKELQAQKLITEAMEQSEYEQDQRRREVETLARSDVEEYIKDCKRRRRMSLAVRAKEHRHHLDWKREKAEAEREQRSLTSRNASRDRRYVELAKEKERARIALDALRRAQSTFSSNPFGSLLD